MENLENGSEVTESQTVETTSSEGGAAEAAATSQKDDGSFTESSQPSVGEAAEAAIEAAKVAAYQPNFKFKVKDKEFEIDEWARGAIKDPVMEKKVKELYEKAYGLDDVKTDRETLKKKVADLEPKLTNIQKSLGLLGQHIQKGDMRSFFEALQIPKEHVLRYALEEFKFEDLPADQKAEIQAQREKERQLHFLNEQNQLYAQQMQQFAYTQAKTELDTTLSKPEVAAVAQAFDARVGKPGAFQAEVIKRGQFYEKLNGTSITVQQAVEEVVALIGGSPQAPQGAENVVTPQSSAAGQKPVIKNFSGASQTSPTKKVFTSIDDIRKERQKLNSANA
jgi:hypothetical protein